DLRRRAHDAHVVLANSASAASSACRTSAVLPRSMRRCRCRLVISCARSCDAPQYIRSCCDQIRAMPRQVEDKTWSAGLSLPQAGAERTEGAARLELTRAFSD